MAQERSRQAIEVNQPTMKNKLSALTIAAVVLASACLMPRVHGGETNLESRKAGTDPQATPVVGAGAEPDSAAVRLVTSAATVDAGPTATPGDPDAAAVDATAELTAALVQLVKTAPWFSAIGASIATLMATARIFMKPTFTLLAWLRKRAETDGKEDQLDTVVRSKTFKVAVFLLDLFLSVKLTQK